jgi:hypothetical protein
VIKKSRFFFVSHIVFRNEELFVSTIITKTGITRNFPSSCQYCREKKFDQFEKKKKSHLTSLSASHEITLGGDDRHGVLLHRRGLSVAAQRNVVLDQLVEVQIVKL